MRLYESALVRQTESALIAQGAFISAVYRSLLLEAAPQTWPLASRELPSESRFGAASVWRPHPAELDLADSPVIEPFPDGRSVQSPDPLAQGIGNRLIPMLKDAQAVTLAGIRVTDPWGVIVASTGDDSGLSIATAAEVQQALGGQYASSLRRREDRTDTQGLDSLSRTTGIRVFVATPIVLHQRNIGSVLLSRTPPNIVQALYAKRWLLAQALIALLLLAWLVSLFASRLVTRPIAHLANRAESIAAGKTTKLEPLINARTHEIAKLQQSIIAMTERLEQRADALQEFARHVSHEFKTPITSIRGAVEVLRDHGDDMSEAQRLKFLENIEADNERLQRLTQRLLDLTRAEVVPSLGGQQFDPTAAIQAFVADAGSEQLRIDWHPSGQLPGVRGSADALTGVLECLLDNAVKHQASELQISTAALTDSVQIDVADNGTGISSGNREHVFEPFFTTRRDSGGTGLGLTIARKLIEQMQGALTLREAQVCGERTCFRILLPLA